MQDLSTHLLLRHGRHKMGGWQIFKIERKIMNTAANVRIAAQSLWDSMTKIRTPSSLPTLRVSIPCPGEPDESVSVEPSDIPHKDLREVVLKAQQLSDILSAIPSVSRLLFIFHVSSDGTLEFTNLVESHEYIYGEDTPPTIPEFFEDFATRMIEAGGEPAEPPLETQDYSISAFIDGDDMASVVPAESPNQAAQIYATIMDICFFQENTLSQIRDVRLAGKPVNWRA
jgi:hypothetical protein